MQRGFTLLELLVVIVIMSLLAVIAIPSFLGFNNEQTLNLAAADLVNTLQTAESYTSSDVKPANCTTTLIGYNVEIASTGTGYTVNAVCQDQSSLPYPPPSDVQTSSKTVNGVTFSNATFYFPVGNSSANITPTSVTITLNGSSSTSTVSVNTQGVVSSTP